MQHSCIPFREAVCTSSFIFSLRGFPSCLFMPAGIRPGASCEGAPAARPGIPARVHGAEKTEEKETAAANEDGKSRLFCCMDFLRDIPCTAHFPVELA